MATAADLAAIETAIAKGEVKVRFADGSEVTYRSVAELRQAHAFLSARVSSVGIVRGTTTIMARG